MSLLDLTLSAAHPVLSLAGHVLAAGDQGGGTALPDSNPVAPPGITEIFGRVIGFAKWVALGVCVVALIIWGAMVALSSNRGRGEDLTGGLGKILFGTVAITGGVAVLGFIIGG